MQRWDIFCRVIDNHGDLGVCWRLGRTLAAAGHAVRLWVDDASALAWMAPRGEAGVEVLPFDDAAHAFSVGAVVIEAFGCTPPAPFIARMKTNAQPPVWINLEYLSAQSYAARSHGLQSPQLAGPGVGLTKWFFYPGLNLQTGGLLRHLPDATQAPPALPTRPGERVVSVFAYAHANFDALLQSLATEPTLIVAAQGPSLDALRSRWEPGGHHARHPMLRLHELPWLAQPAFDQLLTQCDLNVVRGEDSLVSAVFAGRPFVWNIYAQGDGAHRAKLDAWLDHMLEGVAMPVAAGVRQVWHQLNHFGGDTAPIRLDASLLQAWANAINPWRQTLAAQADLATQLQRFVVAQLSPQAADSNFVPG